MDPVLVVDDEESVRAILTRWLDDAGYRVVVAHDAAMALDVMAREHAGMVFCDVQMPGRDGLWLTTELRKQHPATAVVLATGVSTVPARISMQHGVLAYLVKPFSRAAVLDAVTQGMKWHDETVANGPKPGETDKLKDWLDAIDDMLPDV